jgi:AAA domain
MSIVTFTKAQRKNTHVLLSILGMSGSGKTYSAILIARGLVGPQGKVAMLDTESGRGLIYANMAGGFDHADLTAPYTPERYIEAIKAAESSGYDALIIDSASAEWEGIGGTLELADSGTSKDGKALTGLIKWSQPKARHKRWIQALLNTRMHLILCLRAKEKLVQKGGEIVSGGFVSVQDKRFIYEMTTQIFLPNDVERDKIGIPRLDKCPEDLLPAFPPGERISIETGKRIAEWVAGGAPVDHEAEKLRREAEEAAEGGTAVLESMWNRLGKEQRQKLKPYMENCKSIAKTADEESKPVEFEPADREPGEDAA